MLNCLALFTKLILSVTSVYSKQLGKLVAYAYAWMQPAIMVDGKLPFHWLFMHHLFFSYSCGVTGITFFVVRLLFSCYCGVPVITSIYYFLLF
jgi:hypothetical protein